MQPEIESTTDRLIAMALAEDIGAGDVTARYFVPGERRARAFAVARRDGAISGVEVARRVFLAVDPDLEVEVLIPDFRGDDAALRVVMDAKPEILNHNTETVPRLYKTVRPQAKYQRTLDLLGMDFAADALADVADG